MIAADKWERAWRRVFGCEIQTGGNPDPSAHGSCRMRPINGRPVRRGRHRPRHVRRLRLTPEDAHLSPSSALADTADSTSLGRVAARRMTELNGPSGINLIPRGPDALLARLTLVDLAERSLDLQYDSWQDDTVGKLLIGAVMRAADRGVRVRLLHRRRGRVAG